MVGHLKCKHKALFIQWVNILLNILLRYMDLQWQQKITIHFLWIYYKNS